MLHLCHKGNTNPYGKSGAVLFFLEKLFRPTYHKYQDLPMTLVTKALSVIDVSLQLNHSTIKSICHILLNDTPKPTCIKGFSFLRFEKHLENSQKHINLSFAKLQKFLKNREADFYIYLSE